MKIDTKVKRDLKTQKGLQKRSKRLSKKVGLFLFRATVHTFLYSKKKQLKRVLLSALPCKVYDNIKMPFENYYKASKGELQYMFKYGYNYKKAALSLVNVHKQKLDKYGLDRTLKTTMLKEADYLLAESEAQRNPRAMTKFLRMEKIANKSIKELTLTEIEIAINTHYNDKEVDLKKMSVDSVMQCFEAMKNGNKE